MDLRTWRDSRRRADDAATALAEAMAALGLPERMRRHLRPIVTHTGTPFVHVGMVRAEYVERIAAALSAAADVAKQGHNAG